LDKATVDLAVIDGQMDLRRADGTVNFEHGATGGPLSHGNLAAYSGETKNRGNARNGTHFIIQVFHDALLVSLACRSRANGSYIHKGLEKRGDACNSHHVVFERARFYSPYCHFVNINQIVADRWMAYESEKTERN
jgi:hypothetical protein